MSKPSLVLYGMVNRPSDQTLLVEASNLSIGDYQKEAKKITSKLIGCELGPDERKEIASKKRKWYSECDGNNIYGLTGAVADDT